MSVSDIRKGRTYLKKEAEKNIWKRKIFGEEKKTLGPRGRRRTEQEEIFGKGKTRSSEMNIAEDINNHLRSLDLFRTKIIENKDQKL